MNFRAFIGTLVGALSFSVAPVAARTGSFEDHVHLYNTIQSVGVTVLINEPKYCDGRIDGSYSSRDRILNICQDNATYMNSEVDWTANDLDTLRHEAHHLVQDCYLGTLGDSQLAPIHGSDAATLKFIGGAIGESHARSLMNNPAYQGRPQVHMIEMEAFAVAAVIDARTIAEKMEQLCR